MSKFLKIFGFVCFAAFSLFSTKAFATCSNYTTYSDGQILTASSLNSLQTSYTNCINAVLDGDTFTGNMLFHSGADALFYSDTGSTLKGAIFGDSGKIYGAPQKPGAYGINLNLNSGVFKIECNGAACTAANPGFVVMESTTAGDLVTYVVDEDTHFFNDDSHASSDITGEQFGVTTGVAWGSARPFAVYACGKDSDADINFAVSPNPTFTAAPATANIGYHANPMAPPSDSGMFFMNATDPTTAYDTNPCIIVGAITMTMSTSDDWTVAALGTNTGIGYYKAQRSFGGVVYTMPTAQMGAETGKHFTSVDGGTALAFTSDTMFYTIDLDGMVNVEAQCTSRSANGADGTTVSWYGPYKAYSWGSNHSTYTGGGRTKLANTQYNSWVDIDQGTAAIESQRDDSNGVSTGDNGFSNANDYLIFSIQYKAF